MRAAASCAALYRWGHVTARSMLAGGFVVVVVTGRVSYAVHAE